jgi:hypothetical protein
VSESQVVYYDHSLDADDQPLFPRGEAGPVIVQIDGEWSAETEVQIGPNSHCALVNHGVILLLNAIPGIQGSVGAGLDALVPPASAERAARVFYEADRKTYGARYDFLARVAEADPGIRSPIHCRIAIDNREYQKTLSQLQFLATTSARHGHGIRLRI